MPLRVVETKELLFEIDLAGVLMRWRGCVDAPISAVHVDDELVIEATIRRRAVLPIIGKAPADAPTECERAIVDAIRAAGRRLLTPEIVIALEERHAESTVTKALARMVRDGRLSNVSRRGYGIAEPGSN